MGRESMENQWFGSLRSVKKCLAAVGGIPTPRHHRGVSVESQSMLGPAFWGVAFVLCNVGLYIDTGAAQTPDLEANWIREGIIEFGEWVFTDAGQRAFDNYDFARDDPAYDCIGASWTRIWLNPNVLVRITQAEDHVRLQYEWMDIDRIVPLTDANDPDPERSHVEDMPALGRSTAWYDGETLVIDTIDFAPGYVSTMAEWAGTPQSRRMHTVERISRDGDVLIIETTHLDPAYYREPLVVTTAYARTDFELLEYGCTPEDAAVVAPNER